MKKFICFFSLVIIIPCYAKVTIELGFKTTRFFLSDYYPFERIDSIPMAFNVDWAYEPYLGLSSELLVGFIRNLYLRVELIEYKKFVNGPREYGAGGSGLSLFSNLDVDVIYILPFWHRISPLVYGGINLENFYFKPLNDMRAWGPTYEYRLGIGVNYRLKRNLNTFLEIQSVTRFQYTKRIPLEDALYTSNYYLLGLGRINCGLSIRL